MFKFLRRFTARARQLIVIVYSNGRKFEGPQGITFQGQKRAIQIKRGISYDMLTKMISAKLKLQSHEIISSLTYRFPTSQTTYTDLEIFDNDDVECMISATEKHSDVNVLELYVEIEVVGSSSIPTNSIHPAAKFDSSSNANIGLSNNDEDQSTKYEEDDGGGVPADDSSDTEAEGALDANFDVVGLASSVVATSPQQAGKASSSPPPYSSIPQPRSWRYHVFLSFRGETRKGFTDHLCASLERKGIITFRDEENLGRGEMISSELLKAVEESMFAIIIISANYASSTWCLDELQKIVECSMYMGQSIVPIFYNVEPSDVRHQRGSFGEAFRKHQERFGGDSEKVARWRDALRQVASYSGWSAWDQHEAKLVDRIAQFIYEQVMKKLPSYTENLAGIASRVEEVIRLIDIGLKDVRSTYMGHGWHR